MSSSTCLSGNHLQLKDTGRTIRFLKPLIANDRTLLHQDSQDSICINHSEAFTCFLLPFLLLFVPVFRQTPDSQFPCAYLKFYSINKKLRMDFQRYQKNRVQMKVQYFAICYMTFRVGVLRRASVTCKLLKQLFSPLFSAYQNNDITEFEKILKTNHSNIMDDPFIREHIEGEQWM